MSRKRARSEESPFSLQKKYFINERLMALSHEKTMQAIHEKTIKMLYRGANQECMKENGQKTPDEMVQLMGNGVILMENSRKIFVGTPDRNCRYCLQKAILHPFCHNCNLELCEHCGQSCSQCLKPLCSSCLDLFGCRVLENPCCQECKALMCA